MKVTLVHCALAALLAAPALAWGDDCDHTAERSADLEATGATRLRVEALAGTLTVTGRPDANAVAVRGTACSSEAKKLDEIDLTTRRRGDTIVIEVEMPKGRLGWGEATARLDLVIELPARMAVEIDDSSGSLEISGVAAVEIEDGSGSLRVERIDGAIQIRDGSGGIEVFDSAGPVEIADGSGSIRVERIDGDIELRDGSGSIEVDRIGGSVVVRSDGSGSIRVSRVEGDFRVDSDGSGGISHSEIGGSVSVP